jgi:ABC-2 type transport system ATP-binding protein
VGPQSGITALLGPNGAGKTTTMRSITGYLRPASGDIVICGIRRDSRNPSDADLEIKRRIGYLPESTPLYNEMLVSEFIEFAGRARGLDGDALEKAARNMVERLELGSHFYTPLGLLSKGFRQRVALAATLLHDPEVIILDEPTSGLDPNQIQSIRALIKELGQNRTLILSTHILQEVDDICERAIIIHRGRIVADRRVAELKESNRYMLVGRSSTDIGKSLQAKQLVADVQSEPLADGWMRYTCSLMVEPEKLFDALRHEPCEIREFTSVSRSLDEIFRELTQEA